MAVKRQNSGHCKRHRHPQQIWTKASPCRSSSIRQKTNQRIIHRIPQLGDEKHRRRGTRSDSKNIRVEKQLEILKQLPIKIGSRVT